MNILKKIEEWRRGYSDDDTRNLTRLVIDRVKGPLKEFVLREAEHGTVDTLPKEFKTDPAAWLLILQKMYLAFNHEWLMLHDPKNRLTRNMSPEEKKIHYATVEEGFELFGKYYRDLWY